MMMVVMLAVVIVIVVMVMVVVMMMMVIVFVRVHTCVKQPLCFVNFFLRIYALNQSGHNL